MPERKVEIPNPSGLHARPAKVFAEAAASAPGGVTISKGGREVNAKSVLSVLTLDCHQGDEILIRTEGPEGDATLEELVSLIESGLGEL
ncbi:MAG: HPr family phosphocarrier protein [Actinomycetota bacterium]